MKFTTTNILIGGAVLVGAYMLINKKSAGASANVLESMQSNLATRYGVTAAANAMVGIRALEPTSQQFFCDYFLTYIVTNNEAGAPAGMGDIYRQLKAKLTADGWWPKA